MDKNGYVKFRKGLLEHINSGKMKGDMLAVYSYLLLKADYNNGIVWSISAPYIGIKIRKPLKHVQRQLIKLEKEEYIKRFGHRGKISAYEILINRYIVFNGVLIRADKTNDINNIVWEPELNGDITGTYRELKLDSSVFYVSSYKEIKNIIINPLRIKE